MVRDSVAPLVYWDKWIAYCKERIYKMKESLKEPAGNPNYEPQYAFEVTQHYMELAIERYSRGDAVDELAQYFLPLLDSWKEAERLGKNIWTAEQQITRHAWKLNLDFYQFCFWLIGLALTLNIPDDQWQRLLALIGNEGEDILLDRVIASRQIDRKIGTTLCFPKAYQRLLKAVDAPTAQQSILLRKFVEHWYPDLKDAGNPDWPVAHRRPYWYYFGDKNLEGGAYFGRWCIEAVAAAKAFGIDDHLCLNHPYYPGDLLVDGRSPRYADTPAQQVISKSAALAQRGWLSRWLHKKG